MPGVKVAVVVLENHGPAAVLGPGTWLGDAGRRGGRAVDAYGEVHPSLGNYLALLSGSNQGVHDDDIGRPAFPAPSLAGQLERAGVSWRAYMDGAASPCVKRDAGRYAPRHNPFVFFGDAVSACRAHVVPGPVRAPLPRFTWITPDLCQDMHDCSVAAGQLWMARTLPGVVRALGPRGVLFVTADEGTEDAGGGGRIPLVALGGLVRPGAVLRRRVDHVALLATIQDLLGLPRLPTTRRAATVRALLKR